LQSQRLDFIASLVLAEAEAIVVIFAAVVGIPAPQLLTPPVLAFVLAFVLVLVFILVPIVFLVPVLFALVFLLAFKPSPIPVADKLDYRPLLMVAKLATVQLGAEALPVRISVGVGVLEELEPLVDLAASSVGSGNRDGRYRVAMAAGLVDVLSDAAYWMGLSAFSLCIIAQKMCRRTLCSMLAVCLLARALVPQERLTYVDGECVVGKSLFMLVFFVKPMHLPGARKRFEIEFHPLRQNITAVESRYT